LKKQKELHTTYEKEMSAKLEYATTQVHDLEKKHEDILLKVTGYENRIHSLCTEVQESQKEVNRLTVDLSQKVRLSLEQYHKFKISLKRKYYSPRKQKAVGRKMCATQYFFLLFVFFPPPPLFFHHFFIFIFIVVFVVIIM